MATKASKALKALYDVTRVVEMPLYSVAAAARYCQVHPNTVRTWLFGRTYKVGGHVRHWPALVQPSDPDSERLSFVNLIELHVVASLRRAHDVPVPEIRRAIDHMTRLYGGAHPLADARMKAGGRQIFIDEILALVNVSRAGQIAMREVVGASLARVTHERKTPVTLFPWPNDPKADQPSFVAIDPRVAFGRPYLVRSGVPTAVVYERFTSGDSTITLASALHESSDAIDHAIRLERRAA